MKIMSISLKDFLFVNDRVIATLAFTKNDSSILPALTQIIPGLLASAPSPSIRRPKRFPSLTTFTTLTTLRWYRDASLLSRLQSSRELDHPPFTGSGLPHTPSREIDHSTSRSRGAVKVRSLTKALNESANTIRLGEQTKENKTVGRGAGGGRTDTKTFSFPKHSLESSLGKAIVEREAEVRIRFAHSEFRDSQPKGGLLSRKRPRRNTSFSATSASRLPRQLAPDSSPGYPSASYTNALEANKTQLRQLKVQYRTPKESASAADSESTFTTSKLDQTLQRERHTIAVSREGIKPLTGGFIRRRTPNQDIEARIVLAQRKSLSAIDVNRQSHRFNWDRVEMNSYFQILSTPTVDCGTTILLHFDSKRYLFGHASEGTTRIMVDGGVKLINMTNMFLTGTTNWANTGGLLGLVLSLADSVTSSAEQSALKKKNVIPKRRRLGIHGGPNLTHVIATARHFTFRKGMPLDIHEYGEAQDLKLQEPVFSDDCIKVYAMSISPTPSYPNSAKTPRKRSFDDFTEAPQLSSSDNLAALDGELRDQEIRKSVVTEMFDSSWSLDTLYETKLADVKMPAALFIRNPETKHIEPYKGILPNNPAFAEHAPVTVLVRKPWPAAEIHTLPRTTISREAISYMVKDHNQRGKFDAKKAKDLKVKEGPDFSALARGDSVISMDGKTITPDMVLGESRWSKGMAILDIPSPDYIDGLTNRPEWKRAEVMKGIEAAIWILGAGVVADKRWLEFVDSMKHMQHTVICPENCANQYSFVDAAAASIRRNVMDPDHFPVPISQSNTPDQTGLLQDQPRLLHASRGLILRSRPKMEVQRHEIVPQFESIRVIRGTPKDVAELGREANNKIRTYNVKNGVDAFPGHDADIITLGTGSAAPSKYRNVSATLVRVPGYGAYLLDCGENTLGQLKRVFPEEELKQVLQELKMIWISHMHADHHLGTTSVIKAWWKEVHGGKRDAEGPETESDDTTEHALADLILRQRHLTIASTTPMLHWLKEYSDVEDFGYDKILPITVSDEFLKPSPSNRLFWKTVPITFDSQNKSLRDALRTSTGLQDLAACPVKHCRGSKAVTLTFPNGFKVSYSGDCRPSEYLATIGENSTVLIHEATFDDELVGDAMAKAHSTTSEALAVAVKMKCRRVLLTHFSQRYQKLPVLDMWRVGAALDGLKGSKRTEEVDINLDGPIDAAVSRTGHNATSYHNSMTSQDASITLSPIDNKNYADSADDFVTYKAPVNNILKRRESEIRELNLKVAVAFDYMRVKVGDIEHMEKYRPALLRLYEIEGEGTSEDFDRVNRKVKKGRGNATAGKGIGRMGAD